MSEMPCFSSEPPSKSLLSFTLSSSSSFSSSSSLSSSAFRNRSAFRFCQLQSNHHHHYQHHHQNSFTINQNINNAASNKKDYLIYHAQFKSSWQTANIDQCIQEPLVKLRDEIYLYHSLDNFDESQINVYLKLLHNMTLNNIKLNAQRSIYDISTLLDTLFYLVNAQVN